MDELATMSLAIDTAHLDPAEQEPSAAERDQVKKLLSEIEKARDYDEPARKQYAIDRRYARGDSSNEVSVNRFGGSIDTLKCYYYAKDPDIDVSPAEQVDEPKQDAPVPPPAPPGSVDPMQTMQQSQAFSAANDAYMQAMQVFTQVTDQRRKDKEARTAFNRTLGIICSKLWKRANMKAGCRLQVGSSLTVGPGWLKITWQRQMGADPAVISQIKTLQDRLNELSALAEDIAENEVANPDAAKLDLQQQLQALQQQPPIIRAQGLAIDFVPAEDIQCAVGPTLTRYLDLPWMAHRVFIPLAQAKGAYPALGDQDWASAAKYSQKDLRCNNDTDPADCEKSGTQADSYARNGDEASNVCVWERWDKDRGLIYTLIEGVNRHALAPYPPTFETTRWYPFFMLCFVEVDGERHPQSLVMRSTKLGIELDRIKNAKRIHRKRNLPGVIFNDAGLESDQAAKIVASVVQELIGIHGVDPTAPISSLFASKPTSPIDQLLYDTSQEEADWERIWGIQEALQGGIQTAKTATEADIQQTGFNARTGFRRDLVEDMLSDAACYTAEIALKAMTREEAIKIAGPGAMWPQGLENADIDQMCTVQIRAGSSGKPNTQSDRQAWAALLPIIQAAIVQVGQLRRASPEEIADCIERVVEESMIRSGDNFDIEQFLPQGNTAMPAPQVMPQPGVPGEPPPQSNVVPFPGAQAPQPGAMPNG